MFRGDKCQGEKTNQGGKMFSGGGGQGDAKLPSKGSPKQTFELKTWRKGGNRMKEERLVQRRAGGMEVPVGREPVAGVK